MEKILFTGFILSILLGAGAVGTVMSRYDMGMMQGNHRDMGPRGYPMIDDEEMHDMYEECQEHMEEHCTDLTYEECEEMHEECEEHMHKYCDHDDFFEEDVRSWGGCPMRRR